MADLGQSVQEVIFVKSGRLRLEREIALDHTNYWPVDSKHWEVNMTKTKKVRTILTVNANEYLGARELKDGMSYPGRLVADCDGSHLIIISKEHFYLSKSTTPLTM